MPRGGLPNLADGLLRSKEGEGAVGHTAITGIMPPRAQPTSIPSASATPDNAWFLN